MSRTRRWGVPWLLKPGMVLPIFHGLVDHLMEEVLDKCHVELWPGVDTFSLKIIATSSRGLISVRSSLTVSTMQIFPFISESVRIFITRKAWRRIWVTTPYAPAPVQSHWQSLQPSSQTFTRHPRQGRSTIHCPVKFTIVHTQRCHIFDPLLVS